MPAGSEPLPAATVAHVGQWIAAGAPYGRALEVPAGTGRDYWAFRRLAHPVLPEVRDTRWGRTAIDRFVLAALETKNAQPAPEADRRTLARRLYFDLWGLPPSPNDVDEFVADRREDAYEQLVDRLLESPHFGERFARLWLDVARYADSAGYEADEDRINVYYFRDFVIKAAWDDLPFDQFVRWQVAGDEFCAGQPPGAGGNRFSGRGPGLAHRDRHQSRVRAISLRPARRYRVDAGLGIPGADDRLCPLPRS